MTPQETLAIVGGTALLGRSLVPVRDAVILIEGRAIASVGSSNDVEIPSGIPVLDVDGGTIVPGFIDTHVHIAFSDPAEVLRRGVTTVRDLGWPPDRIYPLAQASKEPAFAGPLLLAAGPMLTVEGGYPITAAWAPPGTGLAVTSAQDARRRTAELVAHGASIIKVALNPPAGNVLDFELLRTICDEAHAHGLLVTAHVHGLAELHKAIDAGIDEMAHMLMSPEALPDETIDRLIEKRARIVPTLSVFPASEIDITIENLARFIERGGDVIYGTDLGNEGPGPGIDRLEVTRMEAAGMPVDRIVSAATVDAAWWLGLPNKGFLEPGMDADVTCLEGPLSEASDLTRVTHVVREGRVAT